MRTRGKNIALIRVSPPEKEIPDQWRVYGVKVYSILKYLKQKVCIYNPHPRVYKSNSVNTMIISEFMVEETFWKNLLDFVVLEDQCDIL